MICSRKKIVTITFNKPILLDELKDLIVKAEAELVDYEVKFINSKNEWVTGNFKAIDKINSLVDNIILSGTETSLEYKGVTSARVKINLLNKSLDLFNRL